MQIKRSLNPEDMRKAVEPYPDIIEPCYDFESWVLNPDNIMLKSGDNIGLAVKEYPGIYAGHYFFKVKGKEALILAKEMMSYLIEHYDCKAFIGVTPISNKAARWFNRKLGFTSGGLVETVKGLHEIFTLTAIDFKEKQNGIF